MRRLLCRWLNKIKKSKEPKPTCKKCGSQNLEKGHYSRGWDEFHGGAVGDWGYYCEDCGHVQFNKTIEEYKQSFGDRITQFKINR